MQLLILHYKAKQNNYADFLLQLFMEFLSNQNISVQQTNSVTEAKRANTSGKHSAIIVHQNKASLSFFYRLQLRSFIKKNDVQFVVQLNSNSPLNITSQELIIFQNPENIIKKNVPASVKMVVDSRLAKQQFISNLGVSESAVQIIPFAADAIFQPVDWSKKQSIKMQYSQGKEYFLMHVEQQTMNELLNVLKAFSAFKKWQHSSMKLLLLGTIYFNETKEWNEKISTYKHRDDVVFVNDANEAEEAMIVASAYAFIHAPLHDENVLPLLQAMSCETSPISFVSDSAKEYASEAAMWVEQNNFEQLGEKMILIYKDETLRTSLIEKGKLQVQMFSKEKALQALKEALPVRQFG